MQMCVGQQHFQRQTILLVDREPLGRERVNNVKDYVPINRSDEENDYNDDDHVDNGHDDDEEKGTVSYKYTQG